jgi:hypothetical protein
MIASMMMTTTRKILSIGFLALLASSGCSTHQPKSRGDRNPAASSIQIPPSAVTEDVLTFHIDRQRIGWKANESALTPAKVAGGAFGLIWSSPTLDSVTVNGIVFAPHLFASPLYVDQVQISGGIADGRKVSAVYAATTS